MATQRKRRPHAAENETPADDFTSSLDQGAPEAFIFTDADPKIVGTVAGFSQGFDAQYRNESYPIILIQDERDGVIRSVHCFHTALLAGLERANPQTGDRIGIKYLGMKKPKSGQGEYKNFIVKIDSARSAPKSFRDSLPESQHENASDDGLPF